MLLAWAAAIHAQFGSDPDVVLARARANIADVINHLPRYTCRQTINRSYFRQTRRRGRNCDEIIANKRKGYSRLELTATDRVRLDVEVADSGYEIYAWPGAARMGSRNIEDLVGGGPIGTGSFGSFLVDIFENPGAEFDYRAERTVGDQKVVEYRYRVPLKASHYRLMQNHVMRIIAFDGSFWLDPESAELKRLTVRTSQLPQDSEGCEATTTVDFERKQIGAGKYLLARDSLLDYVYMDASESENATTWSGCQEFRGESALHFGEPECGPGVTQGRGCTTGNGSSSTGEKDARHLRGLPPGLPILLDLDTQIDTDVAAAGDPIKAKVHSEVRESESKPVLIPAGTIVRGRIRHIEHHFKPSYFMVTISFESIELNNQTAPFAAILDHAARIVDSGKRILALPDFALLQSHARGWGSGTFVFRSGQHRYVVPRGYESKWLTVWIRTNETGAR